MLYMQIKNEEVILNIHNKELYEDAPEEFKDQLVFTMMNEPVILPSGKYVDMAVISISLYMFRKTFVE